jgi:23S rRNA pseudouridine2605 synthase
MRRRAGERPAAGGQRPAGHVPLARALSKLGLASRAEARRLILAGRVRLGDRVARNPDQLVVPERLRVSIDAVAARPQERRVIVFHKPRGTITTRRDPEGRPTVFDVLGSTGDGLLAVGRLDRASTGLLILTNDTRLAHGLTDPGRRVPRRYVVTARGRVTPAEARRLEDGLDVPAARGVEPLRAESVTIHKASGRETHLIVALVEGRNREIRRMFEAIGHEVTRVHRVAFGPFTLGTLPAGAWRPATASEELAAEGLQPPLRRLPSRTE